MVDGQPEAIGRWAGGGQWARKGLGSGASVRSHIDATSSCPVCGDPPPRLSEKRGGQQEGKHPSLPQWWGSGGSRGCAGGPQCRGWQEQAGAWGRWPEGAGGWGLSREETLKLDLQGACGPLAAPSLLPGLRLWSLSSPVRWSWGDRMWTPAPEFCRPWGSSPAGPKRECRGQGAALVSIRRPRGSAAQTLHSMPSPTPRGCVTLS